MSSCQLIRTTIVTIVTTGIVRIEKQNKICVFSSFKETFKIWLKKYDFFHETYTRWQWRGSI